MLKSQLVLFCSTPFLFSVLLLGSFQSSTNRGVFNVFLYNKKKGQHDLPCSKILFFINEKHFYSAYHTNLSFILSMLWTLSCYYYKHNHVTLKKKKKKNCIPNKNFPSENNLVFIVRHFLWLHSSWTAAQSHKLPWCPRSLLKIPAQLWLSIFKITLFF